LKRSTNENYSLESEKDWAACTRAFLESREAVPLQLAGVGNPIRKDDSVGMFIVSKLRKKLGARPNNQVRIYPPLTPELLFSKISLKTSSLIIFDAVEQNSAPGSIIFANIADTKFGYFATHNVPLKLIPNLSKRMANIFVLGIQPEDTDIGEGLTEVVLNSANEVVAKLETFIGEIFLNGIS
jgi:hydrogenase 3 maturation protease